MMKRTTGLFGDKNTPFQNIDNKAKKTKVYDPGSVSSDYDHDHDQKLHDQGSVSSEKPSMGGEDQGCDQGSYTQSWEEEETQVLSSCDGGPYYFTQGSGEASSEYGGIKLEATQTEATQMEATQMEAHLPTEMKEIFASQFEASRAEATHVEAKAKAKA